MTLDQLRIFVAVAEREHMTAAARALNATQSAVSAAIAALETRHQVKLFDRVGRGIVLTEAGRVFLDEARAVLARAQSAGDALADLAGLARGTLRLVASQTIATYWLPPLLAPFHNRHPAITVDLAIGNSAQAEEAVMDGKADLGFVEGPIENPGLASRRVGEDRLVLVQAASLPQPLVDGDWLRCADWISRERGSGTRASFDAAMRANGIDPAALEVTMTLPSNESVRTAVEAGSGVAALSSLVVSQSVALGQLRVLPFDLGPRAFFSIRHKDRYVSKASEALLESLA